MRYRTPIDCIRCICFRWISGRTGLSQGAIPITCWKVLADFFGFGVVGQMPELTSRAAPAEKLKCGGNIKVALFEGTSKDTFDRLRCHGNQDFFHGFPIYVVRLSRDLTPTSALAVPRKPA